MISAVTPLGADRRAGGGRPERRTQTAENPASRGHLGRGVLSCGGAGHRGGDHGDGASQGGARLRGPRRYGPPFPADHPSAGALVSAGQRPCVHVMCTAPGAPSGPAASNGATSPGQCCSRSMTPVSVAGRTPFGSVDSVRVRWEPGAGASSRVTRSAGRVQVAEHLQVLPTAVSDQRCVRLCTVNCMTCADSPGVDGVPGDRNSS